MLVRSRALVLSYFALLLPGCATGGAFIAQNRTNVELSADNFQYVARDVVGSAHADFILGFGVSTGPTANTLAIARVGGTATLYHDAVSDLWRNFEEEHGSVDGRNLVLANVRYDADILNLLLFTKTTLYVHADVVAFNP